LTDSRRQMRAAAYRRAGMMPHPPRQPPVDADLVAWQKAGEVGEFEAYKANAVLARKRDTWLDEQAFRQYDRKHGEGAGFMACDMGEREAAMKAEVATYRAALLEQVTANPNLYPPHLRRPGVV